MGAVKLTGFMGVAPKVAPELLPNTVAQIARNTKVYSGDLIPYPWPAAIHPPAVLRGDDVRTIYPLRDPAGNMVWMSWLQDVEIVTATPEDERGVDQRFYYTGDGAPKVSNYELATNGAPTGGPYPYRWYDLGLPLPPDKPALGVKADPNKELVSLDFSRDNANIATIHATTSHTLFNGSQVTITGFTYRKGTWHQVAGVITVNIDDHGLAVGGTVVLNFSGDDNPNNVALDGSYTVVTVADHSFTVKAISDTANGKDGPVDWDIRNFNATNVEVTIDEDDSTRFTYFSPGPEVKLTPSDSEEDGVGTTAKISLAGNTQERRYVYTYLTPWEEESIGSKPSDPVYVKEGQMVHVEFDKELVKAPEGANFIRGINLYRTLPSAGETEYYKLQTLWFPNPIKEVGRSGNIVTMKTPYPHNLDPDDRFYVGYTPSKVLDGKGVVKEVIDQYTFTYELAGADVATGAMAGFIYYDIAESPTDLPNYWGYYTYTFDDTFDSKALTDILVTDEFDPPHEDLRGLVTMQNNILAGYVGNTIYLSEPKKPWAWPKEYSRVLEHNVMGLSVLNGALIVLTDGYPYMVNTSDPAQGISLQKIDALFPCLSKRGIVKLANMVIYPTNDGLALFSSGGGAQIVSRVNYNDDTWKQALDPKTIIAGYFNEAYFASYGLAPLDEPPDPSELPPPEVVWPEPPVPPERRFDDDGNPVDPIDPPPEDAAIIYNGEVTTDEWAAPIGAGMIATGYLAAGMQTDVPQQGTRYPDKFYGGVLYLAEVALYSQWGIDILPGGTAGPPHIVSQKTYISIKGYTANPLGTAEMPVNVKVGNVTLDLTTATYTFEGGNTARWMFNLDPMGFNAKTGLTRKVIVRKAAVP